MILVLKEKYSEKQYKDLTDMLRAQGLELHESRGAHTTILGLVGDTSAVDGDHLMSFDIVETVKRIQEPYKSANRKFHPLDTVVKVGNVSVGGGGVTVIAGPCSVESEEQLCSVARDVKSSGAAMLRGGAFKPRTSPYAFQGLRERGIEILCHAKKKTALPIVTEIMDISHIPLFENVDVIQVGARNMQNFELLRELGKTKKPILLKRGLSSTVEEFLMSAEYIMAGGNENVILCERGIRTFETATRNTLDLSAVALLKTLTHLPVIVDPSHATGIAHLVKPMAMAAVAAGADGLIIEVHNDPPHAACDGNQSLTPAAFEDLMKSVRAIEPFAYHEEAQQS